MRNAPIELIFYRVSFFLILITFIAFSKTVTNDNIKTPTDENQSSYRCFLRLHFYAVTSSVKSSNETHNVSTMRIMLYRVGSTLSFSHSLTRGWVVPILSASSC